MQYFTNSTPIFLYLYQLLPYFLFQLELVQIQDTWHAHEFFFIHAEDACLIKDGGLPCSIKQKMLVSTLKIQKTLPILFCYTFLIFNSFSFRRASEHDEADGSGVRSSASSRATSFCRCLTNCLSDITWSNEKAIKWRKNMKIWIINLHKNCSPKKLNR